MTFPATRIESPLFLARCLSVAATVPRAAIEAAWHAGIIALLFAGVPRLHPAEVATIKDMSGPDFYVAASFLGAYLLALLFSTVARKQGFSWPLATAAAAAVGLAAISLAVAIIAPDFSRRLFAASALLYLVGLNAPAALSLPLRVLVALFATGAAVATLAGLLLARGEPAATSEIVPASQHTLELTRYNQPFPGVVAAGHSGGAIEALPDDEGYLLVTADGEAHTFSWSETDGGIAVHPLSLKVPINRQEFDRDVAGQASTDGFRVADILIRREDGEDVLYATHHYWKHDEQCYVVRLSAAPLLRGAAIPDEGSMWRTVFETSPCLEVGFERGTAFAGVQIGGNLAALPDGRLLMTVGDHQFDGFYQSIDLVSDMGAHYGKTVAVDPRSGVAEIFTSGHRNAQGLTVGPDGRIWSTEHGPQGGDELNQLVEGRNYGYPTHSYGTEYGTATWPPSERYDATKGDVKPTFAWVPSIGISEAVVVSDPAFERWQDDLLIASLRGMQVWRVRLESDRVAYAEPIGIGERIRDMVGSGNGEIVLWTDAKNIVRLRPLSEVDDGGNIFAVSCGGCHDDYDHRIGPSLRGLWSRDIATAKGYAYSPALRELGGHWTADQLDAFIADPEAFAPGTRMNIQGVADPEQRKKIIEYLAAEL